jgi:hypothetical protein
LVISSALHISHLFDATLASCSQLCRQSRRTPGRPWSRNISTSLELFCPSAYSDPSALLLTTPFEVASENHCPGSRRFRTQGLATLSAALKPLSDPQELSFNSQHSWALPFKALLLSQGRNALSNTPAAPALSYKTLADFVPALQRFQLPEKAVLPFTAPRRISSGRSQLLSWAYDLSGSLMLGPMEKASPFLHAPHALKSSTPYEVDSHEPQGGPASNVRPLPLSRMPACLAFLTICICHLLKRSKACGLFFPLKDPTFLTKP